MGTQYVPTPVKTPIGLFQPVGNGQCVNFVQAHGFEGYSGNAYEWSKYIDPSAFGWPGDAILLDEGPYQHLALIVGNKDGYNIVEQNYAGPYIITHRTIPYNYPLIVGIIPKPVKNDAL